MSVGLYLHIPFCKAKCAYCDFASYPNVEGGRQRAVVDAMLAEMARAEGLTVGTVYIGGGTPTVLPTAWLAELLCAARKHFHIEPGAEITVEANPCTVDAAKLAALREVGVNRLSLGAQAAQPELLATLGRIHCWEEVEAAARAARKAGINNLNLDLIYGIPGQTPAMFRETLERALALSPRHLSAYSLIVEEGTPFHFRYAERPDLLPTEDTVCEMADDAEWMCQDAGLVRYEISNYAVPGFESRHNLGTWHRRDYLGIGVGAHSLLNNFRWANAREIDGYLAGEREEARKVSPEEARFERLMLGLRLVEGIPWGEQAMVDEYLEKMKALRDKGLVEFNEEGVWPTRRGLELNNRLLVELMGE